MTSNTAPSLLYSGAPVGKESLLGGRASLAIRSVRQVII